MYKTPTFAEPQQCNRPFSTGQLSAFIIQVLTHIDNKLDIFISQKNYIYVVYKLRFCTCYNLNDAKIQVITCTKLGRTCYNMYKILFKNGFNLYNI